MQEREEPILPASAPRYSSLSAARIGSSPESAHTSTRTNPSGRVKSSGGRSRVT